MNIFISYAHKDEEFKDELLTMLAGLVRKGVITSWQDRVIEPGQLWRNEIKKAIETCEIGLLLISPNFIASDFIYYDELKELLNRRREEGLLVIPILLRKCLWEDVLGLGKIQALPTDLRPVISFRPETGERDEVWHSIAKFIEHKAINQSSLKPDKAQTIKPSIIMESTLPQPILALMQAKLEHLEKALILETDAAVIFKLETQILELKQKIAEKDNRHPK